jgi:glycerol-3-phosphate dehydrogenase
MTSTALNAARRARELDALADAGTVDVLVVGGGATGAGIALDAAARGLSVVLAERADLASGTSRWSSKLVHGGLRYLAHGDVGIAYESAVERGRIMTTIAPHLTRALPQVLPLLPDFSRPSVLQLRAGLRAGDLLRRLARTSSAIVPGPRRLAAAGVRELAPSVRSDVTGGLLFWDGQLTDDARLVVALARTAAGHGAMILTRCAAAGLTGEGATLTDQLTGAALPVRARVVINAAGVWAGQLVPEIALRPSRGTHLVLPASALPGLRAALLVPLPGEGGRFVFALPVPGEDRIYLGLTDEPADGAPPDVPEPTEAEITFLLAAISALLDAPLRRDQVAGAFAGLRPLLAGQDPAAGTADLSRRHAVLTSADGVITVVGGKLTTYRRMAEDAVDAAVRRPALAKRAIRACPTARLPLVGAAPVRELRQVAAPARLVARYGTEAPDVLALGQDWPQLASAAAAGVTGAELLFGLQREGALDASDLLDRRTRVGLVPADRALALPMALAVLAEAPRAG